MTRFTQFGFYGVVRAGYYIGYRIDFREFTFRANGASKRLVSFNRLEPFEVETIILYLFRIR